MTEEPELNPEDAELAAMAAVFNALRSLDSDAQNRVIEYVERRLGFQRRPAAPRHHPPEEPSLPKRERSETDGREQTQAPRAARSGGTEGNDTGSGGELEGVSPVARKWMLRNGLTTSGLSGLYSLGIDEIDLVARKIPGKSARERLHNVLLLQGVASYLSTGVARVENDKLKEAMRHYDADPGRNFAAYLKDWAGEITGTRASGFSLTTRGLNTATEIIKKVTGGGPEA